jgi:ribosome maturation factor RimP
VLLLEDVREKVVELAAAVAAARGVGVWDASVKRGPRGWVIRVTLDRADGFVTVEDCAEVNLRLRARLELENTLAGEFDLEVSSPGLERKLRGPADFERFRGMLARVKIKGGLRPEVVVGRIVKVDEKTVELDTEEGRRVCEFASIAEARIEPELPGFEKNKHAGKKAREQQRPRKRR